MTTIELRQLEYFVAVAEELHFGRAARRIGVAQPALSQQIQRMERVLGVDLFDRTSRRVSLTPAGELLLPAARGTLQEAEAFIRLAHLGRDGKAGRLRIGFVAPAINLGLPNLIKVFCEKNPTVELSAQQMSALEQATALENHEIDVGLTFSDLRLGAPDAIELFQDELILVLPESHRLAGQQCISLERLSNDQFIGYSSPDRKDLSAWIWHACMSAGFSPQLSYHGPQITTGVAMVAAGLGVTLIPSCSQDPTVDGVVFIPIAQPVPRVGLSLIYNRARSGPLVDNFISFAMRGGLKIRGSRAD